MLKLRLPLVCAVALATVMLSRSADAIEAKSFSKDTPSFYLYGSPAFFAIPIGDDDVTDVIDFSYQWGLGLGGMFTAGDNFGIGIGFAFEHNPATLDGDISAGCDLFNTTCQVHAFRLLPELRLGGVVDQLFAYGFITPGLGLVYTKFGNNDDVDAGFDIGFGGGVQYIVYKGLFVGGDLGFDLGFYNNDEVDIGDNSYNVYAMDLKALIGYYF